MGLGLAFLVLLIVFGYMAFDAQRKTMARIERKLDLVLEKMGTRDTTVI